jgi:hypothetical protein
MVSSVYREYMELRDLTAHSFSECLHSTFQVQVPGFGPVPVELTDVVEGDDSPRLEQFSLIFHNADGARLPQTIYDLQHEKLGTISLFLVPLGPREGRGMDYQAVFNRIRPLSGSAA